MMIRSITPADQEQLLLLEEELHDNEEKKHKATLEEALGSKEAISQPFKLKAMVLFSSLL